MFFWAVILWSDVYSLNVPVPGQVAKLAGELARELPEAYRRPRGEHTLGVKRLVGTDEPYSRLETKARETLTGQPGFECRITGIDYFTDVPKGSSPVVYLAVESPELHRLHKRLAAVFDPVEGVETPSYSPHVTIARGGSLDRAKRVADRDIEQITWRVEELVFWDGQHNQPVSTVSLPA